MCGPYLLAITIPAICILSSYTYTQSTPSFRASSIKTYLGTKPCSGCFVTDSYTTCLIQRVVPVVVYRPYYSRLCIGNHVAFAI
jgi:hypothetical protein